LNKIEELPDIDLPDVFGMQNSADIECRVIQTNELLSTLLLVEPKLSEAAISQGLKTID
jgi:hypothetical protein